MRTADSQSAARPHLIP